MLTTTCRKWAALTRLVLRKAAEIKPSTIVKLWRHSAIALWKHVNLCNIDE